MTVDPPEFQKDSGLEKNIVNDDEIPNFAEKKCTWLWTWCIGPLIKLCLWSFQNYMALKTAFGYINASQQSLNITVGEETFDASDLGIKVNSNNSECQNLGNYSPDDGILFAKLTFCICLIPTVLLSVLFLMDMRKMLKKADKWNWCNTILFVFGMITCTGYLIKHLMMIIFGVKARRLLKQKNDPFDPEVQKFWFLHRHAQSHLEHTRRMEALIKLVPQTILQLYIIWYIIDNTPQGYG